MRLEKDYIGSRELPEDALYGIHAIRARENFPDHSLFPLEWYKAIGMVKKACYLTVEAYHKAVEKKNEDAGCSLPARQAGMQDAIQGAQRSLSCISYLIKAAEEVSAGKYFDSFIVPAISGGAGTSINMNVNEIITNVALIKMGRKPGDYKEIDPLEQANVFQSTNDVIPTSLKLAVMQQLNLLEKTINDLRFKVEDLEGNHRNDLRIGYTQMQEAVPSSFGILFSNYNEALSRDWWRVSKCFERIKLVNLGGSAIGTGISVPRFFIMEAIQQLQQLSGLPVTRSENLPDTTSNLDAFVEVHATLKAHAVNLEKMVSDLRLLASDLCNPNAPLHHGTTAQAHHLTTSPPHQLTLPQVQVGSSIMPGKINPVIPEFVISAAHRVYANDQLITSLAAQGCLELNAYLPIIGMAMIESLRLLIACDQTVKTNLFDNLKINVRINEEKLWFSPAITTALIPYIGYHKASELSHLMKEKGLNILDANLEKKMMEQDKLKVILKPENLLKMGYRLDDLNG